MAEEAGRETSILVVAVLKRKRSKVLLTRALFLSFFSLYKFFCRVLAKLCLFIFDANFGALHWQFLSNCSCYICDLCLLVVKHSWPRGQGGRLPFSKSQF